MNYSVLEAKNYMRIFIGCTVSVLVGAMFFIHAESAWSAIPAPVLALSFDEGVGTTANDSSGNGNNGTVLGAAWTTLGKYGGALDFNGVNAVVTVPDANSLDLTNGMTIELWVYPTATPTGWQSVVTKEIPGDGVYTMYANNSTNNRPYAGMMINGASQSTTGTAQLAANTWTHLAMTYNGTTLILYVNGVQVGSKAVTGNITTSAYGLTIGGAQLSTEFFKGRIDNVRIYNQALLAADIITLRDTAITLGPRLAISQPTNGSTVSGGTVNVAYSVNGTGVGIDHAAFQLDGAPAVNDVTLDGVYQFTNVPYGPHTLTGYLALADNTKIVGSDAPAFSFNNSDPADPSAPQISINSPTDGTVLSASTTLQATGIDNIGVVGVQFYLDNNPLGTEVTGNGVTTLFQSSWNTVGTANGSHVLTARARDLAGNQTVSASVTVTVANGANPATLGSWSAVMNWPLVAVHMTLMPTGEFLIWDAWENQAQAKVWNPTTQAFVSVPSLYGLFCSVHTLLADGRVIVAGGHDPALPNGEWGIRQTNVFDPFTKTWISEKNMSFPRWYPASQRLADGRFVTISGGILATTYANNPEIYDPSKNTWTTMSTVSTSGITSSDGFPRAFLLPDGRIFIGGEENGPVKLLNVATNSIANFGNGPMLHYSAAQYRPGKILLTGGGTGNIGVATTTTPTVKSSYVIDMNQATPAFRQVAAMSYGRFQHNLTVLADGKVFAVGGADRLALQASSGPLTPEIWDPATETWTQVAAMKNNRNYHSTSMLMQDGRVLVAGGGRLGVATDFLTAEIYSPPYLFKGSRPTISSTPANSSLGSTMIVQTPDAASIANVAMVPLASVTHTMDWNQNYIPLTFTVGSGQLAVTMPTNANIGRPGYYMLFLLNTAGVPAIAPIFQLLPAGTDNVLPGAPGNLQATGGTGSAALTWTAATDNVGVVLYNVHRSTTSGFTPSAANRITQVTGTTYSNTGLTAGTYYYLVTAQDAVGNVGPVSNQATAVVTALIDNTPPTVPANLQSTPASSSIINLSWTASTDIGGSGVAGYRIYRGPAANSLVQIGPALVTGTSYSDTGLTASTTYFYAVAAVDVSTNASNQTTAVSTNTPAPSATFQLGTTAVGTISDTGYSNTMNAFRYQTLTGQSGPASSVSVYIPAPIGASPNNQFQVAIYSDTGGNPGTLIAASASKAITAAGWNSVPIAATLAANTAYWIVYNTNGTGTANNSLILSAGGTYKWRSQTFGTWPATFGATQGSSANTASIYATVN